MIRVNRDTSTVNSRPAVTGIYNGGFVVAWDSDGSVKSQMFSLAGERIGAEYEVRYPAGAASVASEADYLASGPKVVDTNLDGYVIAWTIERRRPSALGTGYVRDRIRARAQSINDAGSARGSIIAINDDEGVSSQPTLELAALNNGGFAIMYEADAGTGTINRTGRVQFRDSRGLLDGTIFNTFLFFSDDPAYTSTLSPVGRTREITLFGRSVDQAGSRQYQANSDGGLGSVPSTGTFDNPAISISTEYTAELQVGVDNGMIKALPIRGSQPLGAAGIVSGSAVRQTAPAVAFLKGPNAVIVWRDENDRAVKARLVQFTQFR